MDNKFLKFKIKYELVDNEDTTQNLHIKTYQGSSFIDEIDLGNICNIIEYRKNQESLIKYLKNKIKEYSHEHYVGDLYCRYDLNELIRKEIQDILERLKSGKYE